MKEIFPEYFINERQLDFSKLNDEVLIIFDTNALLDLYRVSTELREEMKKSMEKVKDNVWMPYQVGFEFLNNRKNLMLEINELRNGFISNVEKRINNSIDESKEEFQQKYKLFKDIMEANDRKFSKLNRIIRRELDSIDREMKEKAPADYLDFIISIFEGKVANNKNYDYATWEKEAQTRYENQQPPGYKDMKDKKDKFTFINGQKVCKAYGDYFLWKEILDKAKLENITEVVFISNDVKEDWVYKTKGKKIGARIELIEEMKREASANFRIYSTSVFLKYTSKNFENVKDEAGKLLNSESSNFNKFRDERLLKEEWKINQFDSKYNLAYKNKLESKIKNMYIKTQSLLFMIDEKKMEQESKINYFELNELKDHLLIMIEHIKKLEDKLIALDPDIETLRFKSLENEILKFGFSIDFIEKKVNSYSTIY